ncbi:MAG: right-handed parallel beta-helix repeat-containing protein, partial [Bacteroidales bacterium]|nr:right-handed parallel beta-helix repeat-containing protein [Bacteroidales bacterium]
MKTSIIYIPGILILMAICSNTNAQNFQFQGSIHNDTTWSADTLLITGNVLIDSNVTLTVLPGTFVHINGYYSIQSYGTIRAIGTITDSIVFTHLDTIQHADTSTTKGGWHGIRLLPRSSTDTSFFKFCKIENGKAVVPGSWIPYYDKPDNRGGNIYAIDFGSIVINNSYIANGRTKADGGGLFFEKGDYVLIEHCHFKYNHCYTEGGGAAIQKVNGLYVRQNLFNYNRAYEIGPDYVTGGGGAIIIRYALGYNAYALIENNRFLNNWTGVGIVADGYYKADIVGNIICNNFGAGLWNAHYSNYPFYSNNTIVNNIGMGWSGIWILSPYVNLFNNIVRENYLYFSGNLYLEDQIYFANDQDPQASYCNIQLGYEGEGNIDLDPIFTNPTPDAGYEYDALQADYSLQNSSPCINTGTPDTSGLYLPEFDIAGNPRLYGIRVDMGAYENQVVVGLPKNPLANSKTAIMPNPFKDSFSIDLFGENKINRISLMNQSGITIRNMEQVP